MTTLVRRSRRLRVGAATGLQTLIASLAISSCQPAPPPPAEPPRSRALIVGIDGATMKVLDPMFAAGRLQNLRRIAEQGSYGPLKSETKLLSPRVWTTIATGKTPDKHLIEGWVKVGTDAKADLFYSSDRQGLALWNILSNAGKSVAVVNWLVTYPPEIVDGVMISDHTLAKEVEGKKYIGDVFAKARGAELNQVQSAKTGVPAVYPASWADRALAPSHKEAVLADVRNPFLDSSPDNGFRAFFHNLRDFWNTDQRLASITLEILDEKKPDLMMVLLQGIDRVSHFLFGCLESPARYPGTFELPFQKRLNCQKALYDYYEFTDQLIGRLVEHYDDDDLVMVISDHGFEAGFKEFRTGDHASVDASYGVCLVRGPRIRVDGPVVGTNVVDITPTILDWYGMPPGADMDGRPAAFLTPWSPPLEPIASHDVAKVERLGKGESGGESRMKEDLRSLGYLQ